MLRLCASTAGGEDSKKLASLFLRDSEASGGGGGGFGGGASQVALDVKNPPASCWTQEMRVQSLSQKDLLEEEMATHLVFLPGKSHGKRSLAGYNPWGHKESDMTEPTEHAHTQSIWGNFLHFSLYK